MATMYSKIKKQLIIWRTFKVKQLLLHFVWWKPPKEQKLKEAPEVVIAKAIHHMIIKDKEE